MGRTPTRNRLPPGMRARHRGEKTYYFLDVGGKPRKELSLGADFVEAMRRWAQLQEVETPDVATFKDAALRYFIDIVPTKARRTQDDNAKELLNLYEVFDNPPAKLSELEPVHVSKYIRWRMARATEWFASKNRSVPPNAGHVRANREVALLSAIFNHARSVGLTSSPNPCAGVRKNQESGRDVYIEDDIYKSVWETSDTPLRDAMDLAYLTGQRPADTLKFSEHDIRDGFLHVQQGKTKAKLRIEITGELKSVIDRIRLRKAGYKVSSLSLIVNEQGRELLPDALRSRFDRARQMAGIEKSQFQFRDLRAKAGTDKAESAGDIRQAQKQLGHRSTAMTEHYVRNRKGEKSSPTK